MVSRATLGLAVIYISLVSLCSAGEIDEVCRLRLTKLDPHLSAYIGRVFTIDATHDNNERYIYKVGVCVNPVDTEEYSTCGVVQLNASNSNDAHCAGDIGSAQVSTTGDGVWIELTYSKGDKYHSHCGGSPRTARLIFLCDPLVHGLGSFDFLEENRDENVCFYTFSLAAKGVCGYTLTVGDILLIIGACVVVLWAAAMLGGCLFKRFIQGAKGLEQIPFLEWYREFGNLEADGCDLVCRSRRRVVKEYREPTFGADTDDEDDEKDDNLLPM